MSLDLRSISVRYGAGARAFNAVDGVDLSIPSGASLGLVGESGCGKSSIARAIVGLAPLVGGQILLDGIDHTDLHRRESAEFRRGVQMIFQDPGGSLDPRMTVGQAVMEAMHLRRDIPRARRRPRAAELFDLLKLPRTALDQYPHQFSGGQRQRVAIARALAAGPKLLICDEVTSALDVSVQSTILNLLVMLRRELGLALLFISHDLAAVRHVCDQVAVMYLGRIVETAATGELFGAAQHPYTRALIDSVPRIGAARAQALAGDIPDPHRPPSGCRFHTRCGLGPRFQPEHTICAERDPSVGASKRAHRSACHFALPADAALASVAE